MAEKNRSEDEAMAERTTGGHDEERMGSHQPTQENATDECHRSMAHISRLLSGCTQVAQFRTENEILGG